MARFGKIHCSTALFFQYGTRIGRLDGPESRPVNTGSCTTKFYHQFQVDYDHAKSERNSLMKWPQWPESAGLIRSWVSPDGSGLVH